MSGTVRRFAGFEYGPVTGLRRQGTAIRLGPQARRLLELLLDAAGGVVSREAIADKLWPGREVSDGSIDRCAYLLRKPLREAGGADLVATAYGKGLSLRAAVETVDGAGVASSGRPSAFTLDLWQTAYELAGSRTRDGLARAQSAVAAAAELEPNSAPLWTLAADLYAARAVRGFLTPAEAANLLEQAAERAVALAGEFAPALAICGWGRAVLRRRVADGLGLLDRAVALDSQYAKGRAYRGWILAGLGRFQEAIEDLDEGLRRNPMDRSLLGVRAWAEFCGGDLAASLAFATSGAGLRPDVETQFLVISMSASLLGRHDEAASAARKAVALGGRDPFFLSALAFALAAAGRSGEAGAVYDEALADGERAAPATFLAAPALALGRRKEAVGLLRRAAREGCPWFCFASLDPRLAPLRPEIEGLRRRARQAAESAAVEFSNSRL